MSEKNYKDLIKPIEFQVRIIARWDGIYYQLVHLAFHMLLAYIISLVFMSHQVGAHGSFLMAVAFEMYDSNREQGGDLVDLAFRALGAYVVYGIGRLI